MPLELEMHREIIGVSGINIYYHAFCIVSDVIAHCVAPI